jgi:hypothetical protein
MDLANIFSIMRNKGFFYFDGNMKKSDDYILIGFSKLYDYGGDILEINIGRNLNDVSYFTDSDTIDLVNISDEELIEFINNIK